MRWFLAVLLGIAHAAYAEPWLCAEADGVKRFNYDPQSATRKACVHHPIPSANVWRARPAPRADGSDFPRVDARVQKQRDAARREILERELAQERRALADAMQQLAEQKELRAREKDRSRADANLKLYQDRVRVHLTNISNLEKELDRKG